MICPFCKKRQATLHFLEIVNEQKTEIHICETCAQEKGYKGGNFTIANILSSLISGVAIAGGEVKAELEGKSPGKKRKGTPKTNAPACKFCGAVWDDLRNAGRIGCVNCYDLFQEPIAQLLESTQGSTKHVGKTPRSGTLEDKADREILELQEELDKAVKAEQYEEAASLRDRIKEALQKKKPE